MKNSVEEGKTKNGNKLSSLSHDENVPLASLMGTQKVLAQWDLCYENEQKSVGRNKFALCVYSQSETVSEG